MMKMRYRTRAGLAATLAVLLCGILSCTVKEDRTPCPCYLNVSFADRDAIAHPVTLAGWDGGALFREEIDVGEHDPCWTKAVRKGMLTLTACMGGMASDLRGHSVMIPAGSQADSLYAFHTEVDCTGETAYAHVTLLKQFATVSVDLHKTPARMQELSFIVRGTSCGFDLLDHRPVEGAFLYAVPQAKAGTLDFRIPRQKDDGLTLEVSRDGERLGLFPLGRFIRLTGYDWKAYELKDIRISIDLVLGEALISVDGWEEGVVIHFVEQ